MPKRKSQAVSSEHANEKVHRTQRTQVAKEEDASRERWISHFGKDLFDPAKVDHLRRQYASSGPYKHAVIEQLIDDGLLRGVREEVLREIHYTQKETDIYKIHQSGDLANLDGLDAASLGKLPNLLKLRDALYSSVNRELLESITQCGKLSGSKTDMAINIYTPGSHLLCHDDVIGSRRISYILYLTDPDDPWREEWGGALRLFPTQEHKTKQGKVSHVPLPDTSLSIYPQWNQLSFFAVQPGLSFHDVGEVYENPQTGCDCQPMRVAISGWFHIPQIGEDGFIEGEAEALQEKSSLTTLQSSDERFDAPKPKPELYPEYDPSYLKRAPPENGESKTNLQQRPESREEWDMAAKYARLVASGKEDPNFEIPSPEEAELLLQFINPIYLDPDQVEAMNNAFLEEGSLIMNDFLRTEMADFVKHQLFNHYPRKMPESGLEIEKSGTWTVAKPPHKHRYLILNAESSQYGSAVERLNRLFKSMAFRKLLQSITNCVLKSHDLRIRRFRRGQDYQLAKLYKEDQFRIEVTLGLTPAGKWEAFDEDEEEGKQVSNGTSIGTLSKVPKPMPTPVSQTIIFEPLSSEPASELTNNGGYEMFINGDDDDSDDDSDAEQPQVGKHSHLDVTGKQQKKKADPAVYQASGDDGDDDIRLNMAAGFNRLSIVTRDKGLMRFVKYVSSRAGCDRWDITGEFEVDHERSAKRFGWDEDDDS